MRCDEVRAALSANLDGEATLEEVEAVGEHLSTCLPCRRHRTELNLLRERLLLWVDEPAPVGAASPGPRLSPWRRLAVAASLLVSLATGFAFGRATAPPAEARREEASTPAVPFDGRTSWSADPRTGAVEVFTVMPGARPRDPFRGSR